MARHQPRHLGGQVRHAGQPPASTITSGSSMFTAIAMRAPPFGYFCRMNLMPSTMSGRFFRAENSPAASMTPGHAR